MLTEQEPLSVRLSQNAGYTCKRCFNKLRIYKLLRIINCKSIIYIFIYK